MRKLLFFLLVILVGCEKPDYTEQIDELSKQVQELVDKQNENATAQELIDLKMNAVTTLFRKIDYYPDKIDFYVTALERVYKGYEELKPFCDQNVKWRAARRANCIQRILKNACYKEKEYLLLDGLGEKYLGTYSKDFISDEMNEFVMLNLTYDIQFYISKIPDKRHLVEKVIKKYTGMTI